MAGAGITTASSAASDGAIATADMASAPRAAAQSARRLNWIRDIGFPLGGWMGSLGRWPLFAIGAGLPDVPKYAAGRHLLPPDGHEFVNKSRRSRASARRAARAPLRERERRSYGLRRARRRVSATARRPSHSE